MHYKFEIDGDEFSYTEKLTINGEVKYTKTMARENYGAICAWRWIERAIFCDKTPVDQRLSVLKHAPHAPWNDDNVEWDTNHKSYDADIKAVSQIPADIREKLVGVREALDKGGFHATAMGNIADAIEINAAITELNKILGV